MRMRTKLPQNEEGGRRYQVPVRVSLEMKAWLQARAVHEFRSLNAQIVSVIRDAMKAEHSAGTAEKRA